MPMEEKITGLDFYETGITDIGSSGIATDMSYLEILMLPKVEELPSKTIWNCPKLYRAFMPISVTKVAMLTTSTCSIIGADSQYPPVECTIYYEQKQELWFVRPELYYDWYNTETNSWETRYSKIRDYDDHLNENDRDKYIIETLPIMVYSSQTGSSLGSFDNKVSFAFGTYKEAMQEATIRNWTEMRKTFNIVIKDDSDGTIVDTIESVVEGTQLIINGGIITYKGVPVFIAQDQEYDGYTYRFVNYYYKILS